MEPKYDNYGEVINHQQTYMAIGQALNNKEAVVIGWSDGEGTHHDIFFKLGATVMGRLHGGLRDRDLFVSISRVGSFAFDPHGSSTEHRYISEKLNIDDDTTARRVAELINGVRKLL